MTILKKYTDRVTHLIALSDRTLSSVIHPEGIGISRVNNELFIELRVSSLSFIKSLYGDIHPYYKDFEQKVIRPEPSHAETARSILKAVKTEIDNGWIATIQGLISSELFSNFLEMAEHLLSENYKDPAAVMIGSVLEERLRLLCNNNGIAIVESKNGKSIPKKADLLNAELAGKNVFNKLDQKNVTAWLDLRNKAAHGKYTEYNQSQVSTLLQGVTEFISRTSI